MRIINYIISCILFMSLIGCTKDFLDRKPIDFLAPDNFKTEKDIKEAVNGIYRAYISDSNEPLFTDFIVDNGYFPDYHLLWSKTYNNETSYVVNKWSRDYLIILRANTVLHFIDNVPLSEAAYNQLKGEAIFLRALGYFDLSFFFGDVVLRLKPEGLEEANKALTKRDDIVNFVLSELEEASKILPKSYESSQRGRATKGAALAIKARVLLYNKKYDEAIDYCRKVKDLNRYRIMPNYQSLFLPEGEADNLETIFDMQFETNAKPYGLSNSWYTKFYVWGGYQVAYDLYEQYYSTNGLSINDPNNSLYNSVIRTPDIEAPATYILNGGYDNRFQNRDPRMNYSIVVPYSIHAYNPTTKVPEVYYPSQKASANFTSFRVRKYIDYKNYNINDISGANPVIIRYADVLLMEAEALIEKGTYDETYVYGLINEVRQRESVKMPKVENVEGYGLPLSELREVIRHERRVEFAFEGLRIFDVMRWNIGSEVYKDLRGYDPAKLNPRTWQGGINYEVKSVIKRTFNGSNGDFWPIPKVEIDANKLIK